MDRMLRCAMLATSFSFLAGCAQIYTCCDSHVRGWQDCWSARRAWKMEEDCVRDQEFCGDFSDGYKDGYMAVCQGKDPCLPSVPPRCYWGACNRGPDAKCKVAAWYNGYTAGSTRALSDGMQGRGQIITSAHIYGTGNTATPMVDWNQMGTAPGISPLPEDLPGAPLGDSYIPPSPAMAPPAALPAL